MGEWEGWERERSGSWEGEDGSFVDGEERGRVRKERDWEDAKGKGQVQCCARGVDVAFFGNLLQDVVPLGGAGRGLEHKGLEKGEVCLVVPVSGSRLGGHDGGWGS